MGILQNYKEGNMDTLRSINYAETGTVAPYVIKDIDNPPRNNDKSLGLQFNKRIDDTSRIAQMLIDKPGLKFTLNQALLQQTDTISKLNKASSGGIKGIAKEALGTVRDTVIETAKVLASTLAQVPVNGTGTHFIRGFTPNTYLKPGESQIGGLAQSLGLGGAAQFLGFGGIDGASQALAGTKIIPDGNPQDGLRVFPIEDNYSISSTVEGDPKQLGLGDISENPYLKPGESQAGGLGQSLGLGGSNGPSQALAGTKIIPDGNPQDGLQVFPIEDKYSISSTVEGDPKQLGLGDISENKYSETTTGDDPLVSQDSDYILSNLSAKERQEIAKTGGTIISDNLGQEAYNEVGPAADSVLVTKVSKFAGGEDTPNRNTGIQDFRAQGQTPEVQPAINPFAGREVNTYSLDYNSPNINKETRVGLGNQGKKKNITSYTSTDPDSIDRINALAPKDAKVSGVSTEGESSRDFIKFNFQVITPDTTKYLYFRAFLTQFDDSFNATWDTTKYLGRAEELYTYGGFSRNIGIGFIISAATREEMKPLYQKMAYLASSTAPTYGDGKFMRGTLVKVTIGDYIYEVPGILESVKYSWDTQYSWEIAMQSPEGETDDDMQELPHTMNCSLSFKPIHTFIPETGLLPFITNPTPGSTKKPFILNPQ